MDRQCLESLLIFILFILYHTLLTGPFCIEVLSVNLEISRENVMILNKPFPTTIELLSF